MYPTVGQTIPRWKEKEGDQENNRFATGFSISTLCTPSWKWVLPKALDKFIFNEAETDAYGDNFCRLNAAKFQDAIHNMDMETAAKIFTHGVESTLKNIQQLVLKEPISIFNLVILDVGLKHHSNSGLKMSLS